MSENVIEEYSGSNVCDTQDDFNISIRKAIKQNNRDVMDKGRPWIYVYIVIWFIFLVWALIIAMQVQSANDRIVHLVFAMVFGPAYVLAHYIGIMANSGMYGSGFGQDNNLNRGVQFFRPRLGLGSRYNLL